MGTNNPKMENDWNHQRKAAGWNCNSGPPFLHSVIVVFSHRRRRVTPHRHGFGVLFRPGGGVKNISGGKWEDGWWKRTTTNVTARIYSHNKWASHFMGPPSYPSAPKSSVKRGSAAHIPLERGGTGCGCRLFCLSWGVGGWAHIHQKMGGARVRFLVWG